MLSNKEAGITTEKQRVKLLKHQLPGNSMLSEKEDSKLGSRQNRYGVFDSNNGDFHKVVEIERTKVAPKSAADTKKKLEITEKEATACKEFVGDMLRQL